MMATSPSPNRRAALLSGLRTGGVRSVSSPLATHQPHTAAPAGRFHLPSLKHLHSFQENDDGKYGDIVGHDGNDDAIAAAFFQAPATAGLADVNRMSRFLRQPSPSPMPAQPAAKPADENNTQTLTAPAKAASKMNANSPPFVPGGFSRIRAVTSNVDAQSKAKADADADARAKAEALAAIAALKAKEDADARIQARAAAAAQAQAHAEAEAQAQAQVQQALMAQMVQLEMLKAQVQQQQQQQQQQQAQLFSLGGQDSINNAQQAAYLSELLRQQMLAQAQAPPASARGFNTGFEFDPRSPSNASGQFQPMFNNMSFNEATVPMSASINGRFGSRTQFASPPSARLGSINEGAFGAPPNTPSKPETDANWRRGGNNNSVLRGNRVATTTAAMLLNSPTVRVTPPPPEEAQGKGGQKARPLPLNLANKDDESATDTTGSSPKSDRDTATSSPSSSPHPPATAREEASKKLYAGLGIGRPLSQEDEVARVGTADASSVVSQGSGLRTGSVARAATASPPLKASIPVRQPRGPPAGADELGPRNFASRVRRKAIGGLGMLMGARERRASYVEAY